MTAATVSDGFSIPIEPCTSLAKIELREHVQAGMLRMQGTNIEVKDIEYVADVLKAIIWVKADLGHVSQDALDDLEYSLNTAEAALRRVAAEMRIPANAR